MEDFLALLGMWVVALWGVIHFFKVNNAFPSSVTLSPALTRSLRFDLRRFSWDIRSLGTTIGGGSESTKRTANIIYEIYEGV